MTKKKQNDLEHQVDELTKDLQRVRADFENYRKRGEQEKVAARDAGRSSTVLKLLPVIDNIERAIGHIPAELTDNTWAQGVVRLVKNLEKSLESLDVKRIEATPGTLFNPEFHEAIQFDDATGDNEVIAEELQAGYTLDGSVIRTSMVKVSRA